MSSAYGALWVDRWAGQNMNEVMSTWAGELQQYDDATLRRALDSLSGPGFKEFPPTLPTFLGLCKQHRTIGTPPAILILPDRRPPHPNTLRTIHEILAKAGPPQRTNARDTALDELRELAAKGEAELPPLVEKPRD